MGSLYTSSRTFQALLFPPRSPYFLYFLISWMVTQPRVPDTGDGQNLFWLKTAVLKLGTEPVSVTKVSLDSHQTFADKPTRYLSVALAH